MDKPPPIDMEAVVPHPNNPVITKAEETVHILLENKVKRFIKKHKREPTQTEQGEMTGQAIKHVSDQLPGTGYRLVFLKKLGFDIEKLTSSITDSHNPSVTE